MPDDQTLQSVSKRKRRRGSTTGQAIRSALRQDRNERWFIETKFRVHVGGQPNGGFSVPHFSLKMQFPVARLLHEALGDALGKARRMGLLREPETPVDAESAAAAPQKSDEMLSGRVAEGEPSVNDQ